MYCEYCEQKRNFVVELKDPDHPFAYCMVCDMQYNYDRIEIVFPEDQADVKERIEALENDLEDLRMIEGLEADE